MLSALKSLISRSTKRSKAFAICFDQISSAETVTRFAVSMPSIVI